VDDNERKLSAKEPTKKSTSKFNRTFVRKIFIKFSRNRRIYLDFIEYCFLNDLTITFDSFEHVLTKWWNAFQARKLIRTHIGFLLRDKSEFIVFYEYFVQQDLIANQKNIVAVYQLWFCKKLRYQKVKRLTKNLYFHNFGQRQAFVDYYIDKYDKISVDLINAAYQVWVKNSRYHEDINDIFSVLNEFLKSQHERDDFAQYVESYIEQRHHGLYDVKTVIDSFHACFIDNIEDRFSKNVFPLDEEKAKLKESVFLQSTDVEYYSFLVIMGDKVDEHDITKTRLNLLFDRLIYRLAFKQRTVLIHKRFLSLFSAENHQYHVRNIREIFYRKFEHERLFFQSRSSEHSGNYRHNLKKITNYYVNLAHENNTLFATIISPKILACCKEINLADDELEILCKKINEDFQLQSLTLLTTLLNFNYNDRQKYFVKCIFSITRKHLLAINTISEASANSVIVELQKHHDQLEHVELFEDNSINSSHEDEKLKTLEMNANSAEFESKYNEQSAMDGDTISSLSNASQQGMDLEIEELNQRFANKTFQVVDMDKEINSILRDVRTILLQFFFHVKIPRDIFKEIVLDALLYGVPEKIVCQDVKKSREKSSRRCGITASSFFSANNHNLFLFALVSDILWRRGLIGPKKSINFSKN
jgi:hypothetical protein